MAIKENIISFWKQVRLKSSDMFTMFKIGIGVKVPTHKLHVKDATDPIKVEGLQNDTTDPDKYLSIDSNNIIKYRTGAQLASDIEVSIDDLHGAGVDGAANQLLTDDGDGTVTSESTLTYDSEILAIGADDNGAVSIRRATHSDGEGGSLWIRAGAATGTNQNGGELRIIGGTGTGSGTGGDIAFYSHAAGSSGTSSGTSAEVAKIDSSGNLQIDGDLTVSGNDIKDDDGTTCITFDSSGNTSIGGTLSCADLDITGTSNALTVNPQTGNVAINCISTDADCIVRVADNSTAGTNVIGLVATGDDSIIRNDEGNFKVKMANNATDTLNLDQSGNLTVTGIITGKQREVYSQSFLDDLGTTKHYLPWKDINEQTTVYQEEASMVMPCDGRIVSVTVRMSSVTGSGNLTIGVHTLPPGISNFTGSNWNEEETEQLAVASTDDYHVFHFGFDNAKHFESTEMVSISIEADADLGGTTYWYVTTVVEYDWSTMLSTTSAEYDTAP